MSNNLVIHHHPCYDGFTAAWVASKKLPSAEFIGAQYGDKPPLHEATGKHVYILDFSYSAHNVRELVQVAASVTILDHHKTAQEDLEALLAEGHVNGTFDMERSGARLAWDWFMEDDYIPQALLRIEDRDLWRWQYGDTKFITNAVALQAMTFTAWDNLMDPDTYPRLLREGEAIEMVREKDIKSIAGKSIETDFEGHSVPLANCPGFLASEVGNELCSRGYEFSVTYFDDHAESKRIFNLRSAGNVDVSAIAKKHGGGGHHNAAGYTKPLQRDIQT